MKILISGSSGLVGSYLVDYLTAKGHDISKLVRNPKRVNEKDLLWDPTGETFDHHTIEGFQAIIHLAGENISSRLWTRKQKEKIRNSRVNSTRILAEAIARIKSSKPIMLCASATGFYGDRGDEILTEKSASGEGFLAEVVGEWEAACEPAIQSGARVVNVRTGIVLSDRGGLLKRLLPVYKLGLGGKLGTGQQYMPWISLLDLIRVYEYCLENPDIKGPLNAVALESVTNKQFTRILSENLSKPANFHVPAVILNLLFGEMAQELFFSSARVEPQNLFRMKFEFQHPTLKSALLYLEN